jgi:hypothetical protein
VISAVSGRFVLGAESEQGLEGCYRDAAAVVAEDVFIGSSTSTSSQPDRASVAETEHDG